jgi:UDP-glucuronate 4-epimerase
MTRDFTYVDDTVESIWRLIERPPPASAAPYRVANVGGGQPVGLLDFIAAIESAIGRKAIRREMPMQPGDVPTTYASTERLEELIGFKPQTP